MRHNFLLLLASLLLLLFISFNTIVFGADDDFELDDDDDSHHSSGGGGVPFIGSGPGHGSSELDWPATLVWLNAGKTLLAVTDHTNDRVQILQLDAASASQSPVSVAQTAKFVRTVTGGASDRWHSIVKPIGVAPLHPTGKNDKLIVSDTAQNQIKIIDVESDRVLRIFGTGEIASSPDSTEAFTYPKGVSSLHGGSLIAVADPVNGGRVVIVDVKTKKFVNIIRSSKMVYPWGIAPVRDVDDSMFVVVDRNEATLTVFRVSKDGYSHEVVGIWDASDGRTGLRRPTDVAVLDAEHLVFAVCDSHNHRVRIVDFKKKKVLGDLGHGEGKDVGYMEFPFGVAARPVPGKQNEQKFHVFVAERHNMRLQVFDFTL